MKIVRNTLLSLIILLSLSCQSKTVKKMETMDGTEHKDTAQLDYQDSSKYQTAYFASGCFWCVEAIFESVKGVKEVISGYAGGPEVNPTYEMVGSGRTGHAETVAVYYDPKKISFKQLVEVFFGSHDPTTLNRQGPDQGTQYRSIAFYRNDREKQEIEDYIAYLKANNVYDGADITTQVLPLKRFYKAEDYHQDYEKNHPNNPYIKAVSIPRLHSFKQRFKDYLKEDEKH